MAGLLHPEVLATLISSASEVEQGRKAGSSKERFSGNEDIVDAFLCSSGCIGCFHHLFFILIH